jgi:hypothetical protein
MARTCRAGAGFGAAGMHRSIRFIIAAASSEFNHFASCENNLGTPCMAPSRLNVTRLASQGAMLPSQQLRSPTGAIVEKGSFVLQLKR